MQRLSSSEAAEFLGVSAPTLYRMEKKGLIYSTKTPGGQRRFDKMVLEKYLEKSSKIKAPQNPSLYKIPSPQTETADTFTTHKVIFADCRNMKELKNESVHLIITSPPYFNAPFDYSGFFKSYEEFLSLIKDSAKEMYRVLAKGRVACINCDDMLVDGKKYPIVADITRIIIETGFRYRDKIIWRKPEGYIRISRRSGVLLQHPYPMYFYPDNLQETILIFQKGKYHYGEKDGRSKIDIAEYQKNKWNLTVWEMTNRLPSQNSEKYPAAFPDELPYRLIKLFSNVEETVLDPFLGSGTTSRVSRQLRRNSIGYEIDKSLESLIKSRLGWQDQQWLIGQRDKIEFIFRQKPRVYKNQSRRRARSL